MKQNKTIWIFVFLFLVCAVNVNSTVTGGNVTYDGIYTIRTFYSNGTFNTTDNLNNVSILIVAGGGGGGYSRGGGGGAGGLYYNSSFTISTGNHNITIGQGGNGGTSGVMAQNGTNSSFDNIKMTGGGAGGGETINTKGSNGGSGGGGSATISSGIGIFGQGNNGTADITCGAEGCFGGGGGGAGANATYNTQNGGVGKNYSISGLNSYYAGGGAGANNLGTSTGIGGLGGGANTTTTIGGNGTANTGGGGAGGNGVGAKYDGGNGGSGIVIIRYIEPSITFVFNNNSESNTTKYLPQNYIIVNVTATNTSTPLQNMTIYLYNSTGLYSTITTTNNTAFVNFTVPMKNDTYYYNVTATNGTTNYYSSTYTNYIRYASLNLSFFNSITGVRINNSIVQFSNINRSIIESIITSDGVVFNSRIVKGDSYILYVSLTEGNYADFNYSVVLPNVSNVFNLSISPINAGTVFLIYEGNNSYFNCSKLGLTSCKLYLGDTNTSVFDFKTNNSFNYSFDLGAQTKFRLELLYPSLDIVTRYYDISVVPNLSNIRLCANPINVTHYEMIIYSASQRAVNLINPFSNCIVGADYTRFAYQDAFILRTLTIDMPYYLYTFDNGVQEFLVGIDGSVESFINIDTLEFRSQAFDISIVSDSLTVYNNLTYNQTLLSYINYADDNAQGNLSIFSVVDGTQYLSTGLLFNPNNFTVLFDYSAINYSNSSLFKAVFCYVKDDGDSDCDEVYFNLASGFSGKGINSNLAFMIAVVLIILGFTMTQSKLSFSWFGIIMLLTALFILAFSPMTWYTKALMGLIVIYIVFIAFIMPSKARDTILG